MPSGNVVGFVRRLGQIVLFVAMPLCGCSTTIPGLPMPPMIGMTQAAEWVSDPEGNSESPQSMLLRGDGEFFVNNDFPPGVYRTSGARANANCEWQRVEAIRAGGERIVESGNAPGSQRVYIKPTDLKFRTAGCTAWVLLHR